MKQSGIVSEAKKLTTSCALAEKRIKALLSKWHWIVTQRGWKFDVFYCLRAEDMPERATYNAAGYALFDWPYLSGEIHFNLAKVRELSQDDLEEAVVHELTHLLLAQGTHSARRSDMERCVTETSRLLIAVSKWRAGKR